jgi:two-component system LytT family sensor kinase
MRARLSTQWKVILGGWGFYALYMAAASYIVNARLGRPIPWGIALTGETLYSAIWVILTPLVLWLGRWVRFDKRRWAWAFVFHFPASVLFAIVHKTIHGILVMLFRAAVEGQPFSWDVQYRQVLAYFDYGIQLYWIILAVQAGYDYYVRYRDKEVRAATLEAELVQAQLSALKMQLRPHFMFNTLHTIAGLVRTDEKQAAVKMIAGLSDMLRATLEGGDEQEVPLAREIDFVHRYLEIEKVRFGSRLTTVLAIEPAALDARVPNLILQPLVENAVTHGLAPKTEGGTIEIGAARRQGMLELWVRDDGIGVRGAGDAPDRGIGLSNTRSRLARLYGAQQSFTLGDAPGGGVIVSLRLPWNTQKGSVDESSPGSHC